MKDQFEVVPSPDLLYRMGFLPRPRIAHDVTVPTSVRERAGDEEERKDFDDVPKSFTLNEKEKENVELEEN